VEIGPKGQSRDVDLLLRLGSTVFIGELKCKVFPATPKDLRWHFGSKATSRPKGTRRNLRGLMSDHRLQSRLARIIEYESQHYRSLTVIAERITGAHWSGPRFFGLTRRAGASVAAAGR
jgi:hypothetical protein